MRVVIAVLALLAVAAAAPQLHLEGARQAAAHVAKVHEGSAAVRAALARINAITDAHMRQPALQDLAECSTALNTLRNSACYARFNTLMSQGPNTGITYDTKLANTTSYCSACDANLTASLSATATLCAPYFNSSSVARDFRLVLQASKVPCVRDDAGTLCLPTLWRLVTFSSSLGGSGVATAQQLDTLCVPCLRRALNAFAELMPANTVNSVAPAIDLLCLKDLNSETNQEVYCYLEFQGFQNGNSDTTDPAAVFSRICRTNCLRKMFRRIADFASAANETSPFDSFADKFDSFCLRDGNEYCGVRVLSAQQSLGEPPAGCIPTDAVVQRGNGTCLAACKPFFDGAIGKFGCCSRYAVNILTSGPRADDVLAWMTNKCGVTVPPGCVSGYKVVSKLVIRTIKLAFFLANRAAIIAAIKKDVANAAGVSVNDVTLDVSSAAAPSSDLRLAGAAVAPRLLADSDTLTCQVTIATQSQVAANSVKASFTNNFAAGSVPMPSLEQTVPVSARTSPDASVSPDPAASTVTVEGAAGRAASTLALAVAVAASIFALRA